jgi:hypothetical protein
MYRRLAAPPQIEHARGRRHAVTYPFLREVNRWVGVPLTGIRRRQDPIADAADWAQESMANQASVVVDGRDQLKNIQDNPSVWIGDLHATEEVLRFSR